MAELCYVSKNAPKGIKDNIRASVCHNLPVRNRHEDNDYCVLHYPYKEKTRNTGFNSTLEEVVENGQNDFRYVYFPENTTFFDLTITTDLTLDNAIFDCRADFRNNKFENQVSFINAVFKENVNFGQAIFNKETDFSEAKFESTANFSSAEFKDITNFTFTEFASHTYFRDVNFRNIVDFSNAKFLQEVSFTGANFFNFVDFISTQFSENVIFLEVSFLKQVLFYQAEFSKLSAFDSAIFKENLFFNFAKFGGNSITRFDQTLFHGTISLQQTDINGFFYFEGGNRITSNANEGFTNCFPDDNSLLVLENARIKSPSKIFFHTIRLCPNWFINIDSRDFVFTDCRWEYTDGNTINIKNELKSLKQRNIFNPQKLLTISYRQLAENAEKNIRYEEASSFRKMAFETERLERSEKRKIWLGEIKKILSEPTECKNFVSSFPAIKKGLSKLLKSLPFDFIHFLYRWLSGYGEKWFRAFCWLCFIWIAFAFIYSFFGTFKDLDSMKFPDALGYSLQVMTLQKPEPRPHNWLTYLFYGFETILAPLQAALLALAIRRKFMR